LALREEIGDFGELVYAGMDWVEPALNKRSMQLMAEEVMPRVNAAIGKSAAAAVAPSSRPHAKEPRAARRLEAGVPRTASAFEAAPSWLGTRPRPSRHSLRSFLRMRAEVTLLIGMGPALPVPPPSPPSRPTAAPACCDGRLRQTRRHACRPKSRTPSARRLRHGAGTPPSPSDMDCDSRKVAALRSIRCGNRRRCRASR